MFYSGWVKIHEKNIFLNFVLDDSYESSCCTFTYQLDFPTWARCYLFLPCCKVCTNVSLKLFPQSACRYFLKLPFSIYTSWEDVKKQMRINILPVFHSSRMESMMIMRASPKNNEFGNYFIFFILMRTRGGRWPGLDGKYPSTKWCTSVLAVFPPETSALWYFIYSCSVT